nr:MAG TPA: hypothetical protein [Caudoviricetes sp.]
MSKFILQFEVLEYSSFFYYIWSKYGHFQSNVEIGKLIL